MGWKSVGRFLWKQRVERHVRVSRFSNSLFTILHTSWALFTLADVNLIKIIDLNKIHISCNAAVFLCDKLFLKTKTDVCKFHHVIVTFIMSYMIKINMITFIIFKPSTGGFNWWTGYHILIRFSQTVSWFTAASFWNSFTQYCWKERSAVRKNVWILWVK
jgi:hypothetical protein